MVAPCAGAWIELVYHMGALNHKESHPVRVRELNSGKAMHYIDGVPCAGAWIETTV